MEDLYPASVVLDEAAALQSAGDHGHGGPARSQHHGQEVLRESEFFCLRAILRHEQPAREPLFRFMQAVATGDLCQGDPLVLNELKNPRVDLR